MKTPDSIIRKLFSGGQWAIVNKMLTAISALILNALLTRLLPPEEVGVYYIISSIVAVGMLFALSGTQQGIVRLLGAALASDDATSPRRAIKSCFYICTASILLCCFLYYFTISKYIGRAIFSSEIILGASLLTTLWIAARAIQTFQAQTFRGFNRIDLASTFEGTTTGVLLACSLALVWFLEVKINIYGVLLITLLSLCTAIIIGLTFMLRLYTDTKKTKKLEIAHALNISIPLFVASLALQGSNEIYVWILGNMCTDEEVALYGSAFRLAQFVIIPLIIINSVIPSTIAQLYHRGEHKQLENILRASATIAAIPSMLIVCFCSYNAEFILGFVYGEFYSQGKLLLSIMLAAQLINSLTGSPGVLLAMSSKQHIVMLSAVFSGISGLVIAGIMTPEYGAIGATTGMATGLILNNLIMWTYCRRVLNVYTHMRLLSKKEMIYFSSLLSSKNKE